MTPSLVTIERTGPLAILTMDDGKSNVISPRMLKDLNAALDRAEKDKAVVVLTGREGVFSAGFDLNILKRGGTDALTMLRGGFELAERLLSFPTPVVIACNGHALAMGAFLILSGDHRIGVEGNFKIATNEVAIGLTMPQAGVEICRQRLTPAHLTRAALLAETYAPDTAVEAGFLDRLVPMNELRQAALDTAAGFAKLDMRAHYRTKLRVREQALKAIRRANITDSGDFVVEGARRYVGKVLASRLT